MHLLDPAHAAGHRGPGAKKVFLSRIPWGRVADPQDFIGAVVFLASAASDFVTGEIMAVDGGSTAG